MVPATTSSGWACDAMSVLCRIFVLLYKAAEIRASIIVIHISVRMRFASVEIIGRCVSFRDGSIVPDIAKATLGVSG
jgi:hypothetical protein